MPFLSYLRRGRVRHGIRAPELSASAVSSQPQIAARGAGVPSIDSAVCAAPGFFGRRHLGSATTGGGGFVQGGNLIAAASRSDRAFRAGRGRRPPHDCAVPGRGGGLGVGCELQPRAGPPCGRSHQQSSPLWPKAGAGRQTGCARI